MRRLSGDDFLMFQLSIGRRPSAPSTQQRRFPGVRETRKMRRYLRTCVRVRGAHFEHKL